MSTLPIIPVEIEYLATTTERRLPEHQTLYSAGVDLTSSVSMVVKPGERTLVPTGLRLAIPPGYEGQIRPRSGLALKQGILIPNSPGTIDADYRGEVKIIIWNFGDADFIIQPDDRIAQLVIVPVVRVEFKLVKSLSDTTRGAGGFGSTGK